MGLLFFVPDGSMGVGALRAFTRSADWQNLRAPTIESTMGPTPGEARSQGIPHLQPSSPKSRDLDPALARFLKNYLGNRQGGFLFVTSGGLPLSPRNVTRDSLHPILKGMGRQSAGFHIFRRFREHVLQLSEVRTLLIDYWMGHESGEMSGRYGKQLLANVRWRQECAAKAGIGFALPKGDLESVAILDKSGQVFTTEIVEAVSQ